ncbi:hypothetical protein Acr_02g0005880 [Actinidia rufa]|uniref:Uncharacterized protein n=1 Tax=Actinidia rufa TaxID=165716 RepID=A0A7J0E7C7_9ERIC|nr:hypothetical protein Acr_02g0005880 [Actinidia rufa]
MSQDNDYCKQALQSLTTTIDRKISEGAQKIKESFPSACIYRVPEKLRKLKESAYTPDIVSIGPLHSKDKTPEITNAGHQNELREFPPLPNDRWIRGAKKCYTEEVDNLNEEMLVVDGCFILELLYRMNSKNEGGATPKKYYHILHIVHDHYFPLDPPKGEYHRELMPSASYLDYARVKFVAGTGKHLFKVKFTDQSCLERGFQKSSF